MEMIQAGPALWCISRKGGLTYVKCLTVPVWGETIFNPIVTPNRHSNFEMLARKQIICGFNTK